MSQSIRFQVYDAAARILGGAPAHAYRCRFSDFGIAELPADNVVPDTDTPSWPDTTGVDHVFRFHVRHMAAAAADADQLADARYVRGAQLLLADPTLGGLVRHIREVGAKPEMERGEFNIMAIVATYEVEFSTTNSDPSVAGF